jgi:hypothetical protein
LNPAEVTIAEIRFTQKEDVTNLFAWNFQNNRLRIPENLLLEINQVIDTETNNAIHRKKTGNTLTFVVP